MLQQRWKSKQNLRITLRVDEYFNYIRRKIIEKAKEDVKVTWFKIKWTGTFLLTSVKYKQNKRNMYENTKNYPLPTAHFWCFSFLTHRADFWSNGPFNKLFNSNALPSSIKSVAAIWHSSLIMSIVSLSSSSDLKSSSRSETAAEHSPANSSHRFSRSRSSLFFESSELTSFVLFGSPSQKPCSDVSLSKSLILFCR